MVAFLVEFISTQGQEIKGWAIQEIALHGHERSVGKLTCCVLRRLGSGNTPRLSGQPFSDLAPI